LGRLKLKKLTPAHVQGFYRDRLDAGFAPASVNKLHVVLHKALKQAVEWHTVPRNVAGLAKAPRPSATKEISPLSAEEARRLLEAACGDRLEALYVLAVHTGMRQGELLGLKWQDVDLENATLSVRRTITNFVSEGIEATVPSTVRKTVEAVARLHTEQPVTVTQLAQELELDKSAALRRARTAIDRGYLKNLEDRRGRPARLVPADPLPDDLEVLPAVARLQGCSANGNDTEELSSGARAASDKESSETPPETATTVQPGQEESPDGAKKKASSTPSDGGATLQPLTVEDAYREMTRYGSKATYARERYQEESSSRNFAQLVRAVLADKGVNVVYWQEYAPTVEGAVERLETEERAAQEHYDRLVEKRTKSGQLRLEREGRRRAKPREREEALKAAYVEGGPKHGITGRAYPRGNGTYWFQPETGAMGVRVGAEDLEFLLTKGSEMAKVEARREGARDAARSSGEGGA
jgi:hypothetical protein